MNLETAEDVFRTVSEISGTSVPRIPDGERGPRSGWIFHQVPRLAANPALEPGPSVPNRYRPAPGFRLRAGVDPATVKFDLGYGSTAVESYPTFRRLKEQGVIPPNAKFQVALPTQVAVLGVFITLEDQPRLMEVFERQLAVEVAKIVDAVPRGELAIQWDVAAEISIIEGLMDSVHDTRSLLDQVGRMAAMVPLDVTLGFHLCYGDAPNAAGKPEHFIQPRDTENLAMVARGIFERVRRPIAFLHLPVPINRDDDAYFKPLANLKLPPGTTLFLGLVHHQDGLAGAQRRIDTAARHVKGFGVATECGMSGAPREAIPALLRIQHELRVPD
jgi:hypothetical protein